jgi:osmotically-inducible protein OsmY
MNRFAAGVCAIALVAGVGCANTVKGAKQDTEKAVEAMSAGAETFDVKAALIADGRVDAGNINVDTVASTKTVVLKGSVPTAEQKATAERIAREQAKGYTVVNQLAIVPK